MASFDASFDKVRKGDWVRFQLRSDCRVLEGFVQESTTGKLKIGRAPDSSDSEWYAGEDLVLLQHQAKGSPF